MSLNINECVLSDTNSKIKDAWAIRPCNIYKEEYNDCRSIKARFHQYFIHGENVDCSQWLTDYKNCVAYVDSNGNDVTSAEAVIKSEEIRRKDRLNAHYANTTWKKRDKPPENWASPLPEYLEEKNKNTYLEIKAKELSNQADAEEEKRFCTIM